MVLLERLKHGWFTRNWLRVLVHVGSLVPLGWLVWQYSQGLFIIDPVREITTFTGRGALILLMSALACTPVSTLTGFQSVLRVRRALGMYAFVYASAHLATFVGLDYGFDLSLLPEAIFAQPYVIVGFAAGVILLVLAITSTRGWQRRLKRNWKRLHRLVYVAGGLAVLHFLWLSKDDRLPWRYGVILLLLLALRLPPVRRVISQLRHRLVGWMQAKRNTRTTTPGRLSLEAGPQTGARAGRAAG
jgi:sulfoxide reductase heme-binding subunit YedZ